MKSHLLIRPKKRSPSQTATGQGRRAWRLVRKYPRYSWAALFLVLVIGASMFVYVGRAHAASQGPKGPGTAAGSGWTSPGNITAQDSVYASYNNIAANGTTTALQATNFGFTIPTGSTINGVQADVWKYSPTVSKSSVQDSSVQIIKGGVAGGTSQAITGTAWPTTNTKTTYGGSTNLWGQTLAVSDVNASNFGISLTAINVKSGGGATNTAYVDYIQVTIYYTPPPLSVAQSSYRLFNNKDATNVGTFSTMTAYLVGNNPYAVTTADFNGDGKPDLAVANYSSNTVSILLNNGSGGFTLSSSPTVGSGPEGITTADFNGDGHPDLAVTNYSSNTVSILLNNGSGGFTLSSSPAVGSSPQGITTADFNGDGHPDLAVANDSSNTVSILLNNGSGGFTVSSSPAVDHNPIGITTADFNGDGHPDLAVANYRNSSGGNPGTVSILLNNGSGGFTLTSTVVAGNGPYGITTADFNGDGHPDLAVVNDSDGTVSILLNNGSGGFTVSSSPAVGSSPQGITTADFNGDGHPDLAVANDSDGTVSILLNNGSGGFTVSSSPAVRSGPYGITTADFNGDGKPDVAVANGADNTVSVLLNVSTPPMDVGTPLAAQNTAATVPGDGQPFRLRMDLGITGSTVAANAGLYKLQYAPMNVSCDTSFTNTPSSAYQDVTDYTAVRYYQNTYATNGAGLTDTNSYGPTDGTNPIVYETYQGNGTTTFTNPTAIPAGSDGMWDFALTTFHAIQNTSYCLRIVNSDGSLFTTYTTIPQINTPAAAFTQSSYRWFGGNTSGTGQLGMAAKTDYPTGTTPNSVAVADVNGDGKPDIVAVNSSSNNVSVLLNNGSGTNFTNATGSPYTVGTDPTGVAVADVNGDGKPDIVVTNYGVGSGTTVSVLLNNGSGTNFTNATGSPYTVGSGPQNVALADLNGDNYPDIVVTNSASNTVSVLMNNKDGTFAPQVTYTTGAAPWGIALADLNGDGKPDIVVTDYGGGGSGNTVSVFMNNGNGTFAAKTDYTTGTGPYAVALADLNNDGKADIVAVNSASNTVSVLMNNGNGTFATKVDYTSGTNPYGVAIADLNGDGRPDIVVTNEAGTTTSVYTNNGNGTFAGQVTYTTGTSPYGVAIADLNGDNKPDIVIANYGSNTVSVLINSSTSPIDVGSPLGSQNQIVDQSFKTSPLRLRLGIRMSGGGLAAGYSFALQYAIKNGTCAASTFAPITSSTPLQWYTTGVLANGHPIGPDANDPTDGTNPIWDQTYTETFSNFSNISPLYGSDNGVWDFSLVFASTVTPGTDICLRAATSAGTAFTAYNNYPEIQYGPQTMQHLRQGAWFDQNGVKQPLFLNKQ